MLSKCPPALAGLDATSALLQSVNFQTGPESVVKPALGQGLSFPVTTGVTSGSSQETLPKGFWGKGSEPCTCTPDPHRSRARRGRVGREKCVLHPAVWGVRTGVMLGAACRPPPTSSPLRPPSLSNTCPPAGLWVQVPTLARFHGPLPAEAPDGRPAVSSGPCQATGRMAPAPSSFRPRRGRPPPGPWKLVALRLSLLSSIIRPHDGDKTTLEIPGAFFPHWRNTDTPHEE